MAPRFAVDIIRPHVAPTPMSRRAMLQASGATLAAAATARIPLLAQEPSEVMRRLSMYLAEAPSRPLSADVVTHATHHILDTFAAMISGAELPPGQAAFRLARARSGTGQATIVASDILTGSVEAALVNGVLAHADETDDSHSPSQSHPG